MGPRTARRPDSCIDRYSIAKWKWGKLFKRGAALGENPPKPRATRPRRKRACRPAAHQSACAVGSPNATRQQPACRAKRSPVKKNTRPAAQGRSCPPTAKPKTRCKSSAARAEAAAIGRSSARPLRRCTGRPHRTPAARGCRSARRACPWSRTRHASPAAASPHR